MTCADVQRMLIMGQVDEILVACEGVPAVFCFRPGSSPAVRHVISLAGNGLDVALISPTESTCTAVVSIDNVHKPGSTTEIREDEVSDLAEDRGTSRIDRCHREHVDCSTSHDSKMVNGSRMAAWGKV